MNRVFNKNYLRKELFIKKKEYEDITISEYELGYLVKPRLQTSVAISLAFGNMLAHRIRNVNRLMGYEEAEEIIFVEGLKKGRIEDEHLEVLGNIHQNPELLKK